VLGQASSLLTKLKQNKSNQIMPILSLVSEVKLKSGLTLSNPEYAEFGDMLFNVLIVSGMCLIVAGNVNKLAVWVVVKTAEGIGRLVRYCCCGCSDEGGIHLDGPSS